ncbi:MAG: response regulator transcription factor [Bacteroidia bacterium]|nr:response regulator transcription factor [Bacteroidia bacterium]MDW8159016.1 response regulator transcription factor [Bacteroidia bacterium]
MGGKLLLIEDDFNLGLTLAEYLRLKGYQVELKKDGKTGLHAAQQETFDLCLLDVMLPQMDGFELAKLLKKIHPQLPIIFLTAKGKIEDKKEGFTLGADDYLTKPFHLEELHLRIQAVLKRYHPSTNLHYSSEAPQVYKIGNMQFDYTTRRLILDEKTEKLSTKEADLLKLLCTYANTLLPREVALKTIWGEDSYYQARSMDVYITKLRKHLQAVPGVEILNIHGSGYKLILPTSE